MNYRHRDALVHYEVVGQGKPVVILHGLGGRLESMKACMEPAFSTHSTYKRIYVDLPGMGQSTYQANEASSDRILEILTQFVRDVIPERFLVVGLSYGGYLARGILSQLIHQADGIMLLCPVVVPQPEQRILPDAVVRFEDNAFLNQLDEASKSRFCQFAVVADEQTYARHRAAHPKGDQAANDAFLQELKAHYAFSFDVDDQIRRSHFEKPALFLCGHQDDCTGFEDLWALIQDYPRATFSVLDAAGHNLHLEQPELFHALVVNWLTRVEQYS